MLTKMLQDALRHLVDSSVRQSMTKTWMDSVVVASAASENRSEKVKECRQLAHLVRLLLKKLA